jgi:hypothetical protein
MSSGSQGMQQLPAGIAFIKAFKAGLAGQIVKQGMFIFTFHINLLK